MGTVLQLLTACGNTQNGVVLGAAATPEDKAIKGRSRAGGGGNAAASPAAPAPATPAQKQSVSFLCIKLADLLSNDHGHNLRAFLQLYRRAFDRDIIIVVIHTRGGALPRNDVAAVQALEGRLAI